MSIILSFPYETSDNAVTINDFISYWWLDGNDLIFFKSKTILLRSVVFWIDWWSYLELHTTITYRRLFAFYDNYRARTGLVCKLNNQDTNFKEKKSPFFTLKSGYQGLINIYDKYCTFIHRFVKKKAFVFCSFLSLFVIDLSYSIMQ